MEKPNLIEPGMKYFIKSSLKNCNDYRNNYKNYIINIILLLIFLVILGILLLIRFKGKLTPIEKENKMNQQKKYILSKIKQLQDVKRIKNQELVTNLPKFDDYEYDNNNNNKYYL